ncbi:MAG: outer membrane beta-barrel protein, partial [Planctomycetota bacterium]
TAGGGFNFGSNVSGGTVSPEDFDVLEAKIVFQVPSTAMLLGGTQVEIGKFLTTAGAEGLASWTSAQFSRSYSSGFLVPFTHTGVRASKTLIERSDGKDLLAVKLGWANGWDSARDGNDSQMFLTSTTVAPADFFSLTANWFFGWRDAGGVGDDNDMSHLLDLVADVSIPGLEGVSLLGGFDWYGDENGANYAQYYSFSGVLKWEFGNFMTASEDDKMYLSFRGEYVDDEKGFAGLGTGPANMFSLTWTLGYWVTDALLLRVEVRHDKADQQIFELNAAGAGTRHQQTTVAFNSVFKF